MIVISRIVIENFRSLRKIDISTDGINVFSGLNDVGKSNLLKALNLFFNNRTDFESPLSFGDDYSKVALASAQRARKQKQQIKIRLYFKAPNSFPTLRGIDDLYVEKLYDRNGNISTTQAPRLNVRQRSQLTRLVNKIRYFYIPALKGPNVLRFLLAEIGKYELISSTEIAGLNSTVNTKLNDLQGILSTSEIQTKTSVGLPVLVEDFWQRLKINTEYDLFDVLQSQPGTSKASKSDPLKSEAYQIPLELRGEGIKSKFIPPLLKWIQAHSRDISVWGIDEPENSLEFRKAEEVSRLYFEEYSKDAQLFLVSHSLAFIFPKTEIIHTTFRCTRGAIGETEVRRLDNLFKEQDKESVAEEIGALEIQKNIYEKWRSEQEKYQELIDAHGRATSPILYVEGPSDKAIIEAAWASLNPNVPMPYEVQDCGSAAYLKNFLKNPGLTAHKRKMIGLFDCDSRGYGELKGLFIQSNGQPFKKVSAEEAKHTTHDIVAIVLPCPSHRVGYTDTASEDAQVQFLEIEHYFEDAILSSANAIEKTVAGKLRLRKNADTLVKNLGGMGSRDFSHFKGLFDRINKLL